MGRTLSWWLLVGTFFGVSFAFMFAMAMGREFTDVALHGVVAGVVLGLLLSGTSH